MVVFILAATAALEWWKAAILGAVQGVAELLPISSSAHLVLIPWLLRYLQRSTTTIFTVYRVVLGLIILILVFVRQ